MCEGSRGPEGGTRAAVSHGALRWERAGGPEDQPPRQGRSWYSLILQGGVTSRHSLCAPTPHLVHR